MLGGYQWEEKKQRRIGTMINDAGWRSAPSIGDLITENPLPIRSNSRKSNGLHSGSIKACSHDRLLLDRDCNKQFHFVIELIAE